ncbi:MAG: Zn-dependent hydrolase [Marinomonas foliarum]|jgi:beta-ureidopropionase / N-carbamoyl-L-amino-acid hydrolase|uniref:N-carbamoyl-L-amino-acid hydrolase n=1 Tax=Marinomonas foliarum TaxID=491950 RepID=A0A369AGZ3_9GAMM|nr:Zn-dependent hydrolase [Marinomonas foliarum]QRV25354.1 Zn-dependent hydrolase [Marinomonas foliarum]RCX06704.1 N-carbamoyl-L-amino-acid hydrolase [Marinomonas foliarum]
MQDLRINEQRLWDTLMEMGDIGGTEKGGCNRLAGTDLDKQARDLFVAWCEACGCTVEIDKIGNIFARRSGTNNDLPAVGTGSHLDTQPTGGKFDGVFGVLSGVEVLRTLHENNIQTPTAMEFSVWTNEEGSRFQPAMQGSGTYVGRFDLETELNKTDVNGIRLGDELERIGYLGEMELGSRHMGAFFEAHIEQGPILEDEEKAIGIVRLGQGIRWYNIEVVGRPSHSGTTPMHLRKDAMLAASAIVTEMNAIALRHENGLGTVGFMQVWPNSRNTIPGNVKFSADLRNPKPDVLLTMHEELVSFCEKVAEEHEVEVNLDPFWYFAPVEFNASDDVKAATEKLGYSHMDIYAGAGHDACYMADLVPTGMIFTPCLNGISHNEAEYSSPEECAAGANVLLHAMLEASDRIAKEHQ